jgi:hypothetical protein
MGAPSRYANIGLAISCEGVNPVDDVFWHREFRTGHLVQPTARREAEKEMDALRISGWLQGNGSSGSRLHSVVVVLMDLGVCTIFESTVLLLQSIF